MNAQEADEFRATHKPVVKPKSRKKESIASKIFTKVQASKKVIADVKANQYQVLANTIVNEVNGIVTRRPYCYDRRALLQSEVDFYAQNSTALGVLQTLDHYVQEENKHPWELFPTIHFSQEQIQG